MISREPITDEQYDKIEPVASAAVAQVVIAVNEYYARVLELHSGAPASAVAGVLCEKIQRILVSTTALACGWPDFTTKDDGVMHKVLRGIAAGVQAHINETVATIGEALTAAVTLTITPDDEDDDDDELDDDEDDLLDEDDEWDDDDDWDDDEYGDVPTHEDPPAESPAEAPKVPSPEVPPAESLTTD